jgi:hypothetical protein
MRRRQRRVYDTGINLPERFASWVRRLTWGFWLGPRRDDKHLCREIALAPWFHAKKDYAVLRQPMRTSYLCQQRGGPEFVPEGTELVFYYFRGDCYCWTQDGMFVWGDKLIPEGLGKLYEWDHEKYERPK